MFGKSKKATAKTALYFNTPEYEHIVKVDNLVHEFVDTDEEGNETERFKAVDNVSLEVEPGDFIAILGHNGSGKSTLAKHINAILMPTEGSLFVGGMDTKDYDNLWKIRQQAGMVFQNPDNQIIATIVEEDVGFGPENLGVLSEEIWNRVDKALKAVGMTEYRHHSPNKLSGGQKQRVAIAGVMAMQPKCIVLDEPTAMLDPNGRKEVIATLRELNRKEKVTIILITHYMDEVISADKVFVMDKGKIALQGTPKEVFSNVDKIKELGLDVPQVTELAYKLKKKGADFSDGILDIDEFTDELFAMNHVLKYDMTGEKSTLKDDGEYIRNGENTGNIGTESDDCTDDEVQKAIITLENVNYTYSNDTAFRIHALKDINLKLYEGQFIGVIGHTGSGKSTLIQHLDGLIKAETGKICFRGKNIYDEDFSMPDLRKKVGLVFQYPEYQLFESTVLEDVMFGPKNLGKTEEEAKKKAEEALRSVGADESLWDKSPFGLSGGQKRRVAIAGVLAMETEVLILDEPTAALDPKGRDEILSLIDKLHKEKNITIILVSHSMEDVARYADRIIVMNRGQVEYDGTPQKVFTYYKELEKIGLAAPQVTYISAELRKKGIKISENVTTVNQLADELMLLIKNDSKEVMTNA